ncbi:type IV pilus modification protein PilV [Halomonas sp. M20]|uniref:type IV pilus modification protein PilV n=1 Tax=Halomonas sp. M20 TaxID=2763264 RepID=UPI001D0B22E8|nr:type IV pilus modification protein PilV [Halomonas sp. M20]
MSKQQGIGLIEVLVALLLLSVSLLGLGMLQINTMQHQRSSYNNTMAQLLAVDMAERIRANLSALETYDGKSTDEASSGGCTQGCSPSQLVSQDITDWTKAIDDSPLTSGVGRIDVDTGDGVKNVEIRLTWQDPLAEKERKGGDATVDQIFSFKVAL